MRKHYDFSQAKPNPYAKRLKREVTVQLDEGTVDYFEALAAETGIPARTLMNLYLRECAASRKRLALRWKPAASRSQASPAPAPDRRLRADLNARERSRVGGGR